MGEIGVDEKGRERESTEKDEEGRMTAIDEVRVKMLAVAERVGIWWAKDC